MGSLFRSAKMPEKSVDVRGKDAFLKKSQPAKFCRGPFSGVAACSRPGMVNEISKENQDAFFISKRLLNRDDCAFLIVLDGHGRKGGDVSSYLGKTLPGTLN